MRALLAIAVLALLAGCIAPTAPSDPNATTATPGGQMTAKESRDETTELCSGGLNPLGQEAFCATRTIRVEGTIAGISRMDVSVDTFNGGVAISPSSEGAWGFTAKLTARGATADEAKARLDDIAFAWSHVEGEDHFLDATAEKEGESGGYAASFDVKLPRSITYVLVASTSNGGVKVDGLKTDGLAAQTSNGNVEVQASVTQAELTTSNGDVVATLDPSAAGRIGATTSNGRIRLALPEDARHGYDVEATTSNGKVEITMRDGKVGDCPAGSQYYTPPCNHRTFRTGGFEGRDVRSSVTATTSNGDVTVGPS